MIQDTIHDIISDVLHSRLSEALDKLKPIFAEHPSLVDRSEVEEIDNAFRMMLHYMDNDADDSQRMDLYENLLCRTYRVAADLDISWRCKNVGFYISQFSKAAHLNMSPSFVRTVLETYVSDMAMLSLGVDGDNGQKKEDIVARHQSFIERLFASIIVSCQWSDGDRNFWTSLLLSPTIDIADRELIMSAIMISAMNQFDVNKFKTTMAVYKDAADETLRQRALVAFVFSWRNDDVLNIYPDLREDVAEITLLPGASRELLELQKQLIFCVNTEKDNLKIVDEIMPTLKDNLRFRINGLGIIEEKPDDKMRDILNPEADDEDAEKVEDTVHKVADMQKNGTDIYFGGFSHMKRFSFFNAAANWFLPFSFEQPDVMRAMQQKEMSDMLESIFAHTPFCNSDKYSMVFAFSHVFNSIPANMREALSAGGVVGTGLEKSDEDSPAFIRRLYLQDLYRFFRLYPQRHDLVRIFDDGNFLFFTSAIFYGTPVQKHFPALAVFLHDHKRFNELRSLLPCFNSTQSATFTFMLLSASVEMHFKNPSKAIRLYQSALQKSPDSEIALKGLARAATASSELDVAEQVYGKLLELEPGNKSYLVHRALALMELDRTSDAAKVIYEADYRYPNDRDVLRAKAWLMMQQHEAAEAETIYRRLTSDDDSGIDGGTIVAEDYLNFGYSLWAEEHFGEARKAFRKFLEMAPDKDIRDVFDIDAFMLEIYNIGVEDRNLMAELVVFNGN